MKERAKVVNESVCLRRYLKGLDCFDKTKDLSSTLESTSELKLYISKLCSAKSKYLQKKTEYTAHESLIIERMIFIYAIVSYFVIKSICCFRNAVQMNAFEVFEIKQSIEDVMEYFAAADKIFKQSVELNKRNFAIAPATVSKKLIETLNAFHIQKSSDPNIESNGQLYHCYKNVHDDCLEQLDMLQWKKDQDVLLPLQDFLVAQIQKRYVNNQLFINNTKLAVAVLPNGAMSGVLKARSFEKDKNNPKLDINPSNEAPKTPTIIQTEPIHNTKEDSEVKKGQKDNNDINNKILDNTGDRKVDNSLAGLLPPKVSDQKIEVKLAEINKLDSPARVKADIPKKKKRKKVPRDFASIE